MSSLLATQVDIFSFHKMIMPIHQGAHWCLAVVDLERQELKYYDSMTGDDFKCLDRIRSIFLLHVVIANSDFFCMHRTLLYIIKPTLDTSNWRMACPKVNHCYYYS